MAGALLFAAPAAETCLAQTSPTTPPAAAGQTHHDRRAPTADTLPLGELPIGAEAFAPEPEADEASHNTRPPIPESLSFKVASWNWAAARPGEKPANVAAFDNTPKKEWRHTFGAERRTARWRQIPGLGFEADIIALQGIERLTDVRRLFKARAFHVVTSRQLLARSSTNSGGLATFRTDAPPTTAIVFRRRRGVRIAGFRHFLPPAGRQEAPAITVMRLRIYGRPLYVASVDLPQDCEPDQPSERCSGAAEVASAFANWAANLRPSEAGILIFGQWHEAFAGTIRNKDFALVQTAPATQVCTPEPAGLAAALRGAKLRYAIKFDDARTAAKNACINVAEMTVRLLEAN